MLVEGVQICDARASFVRHSLGRAFSYTTLWEHARVGWHDVVAVFPVSLPRYAFGMMKLKSTRTDSPRRRRGVAKRDGAVRSFRCRVYISPTKAPIHVRLQNAIQHEASAGRL